MANSCFSLVNFYERFLRRTFVSAGLSARRLEIDQHTTLHFWGPTPPKQEKPAPASSPKSTEKKPALILIHGFGPPPLWQWRPQVQYLSAFFELYVPELVFFGGSTTSRSERSEVFQAEMVARLMEKLRVERYSVMGTSYGGFVSYHMARLWPERVEKVVIASSGVNRALKDGEELIKRAQVDKVEDLMLPQTPSQLRGLLRLAVFRRTSRLPDFFLRDFLQVPLLFFPPSRTLEIPIVVIHGSWIGVTSVGIGGWVLGRAGASTYNDNREAKIELLEGLTLGRGDVADISPLQQEVLLVWGEHDQIFPLQLATELRKLLGEKTKLEVIKSTSHVPQTEEPEEFNRIVKGFLV
ncbi:Alpha/beta hydrolase fold-1 [Dillenia turbinata]|uniref:Alpha/beta hydrolase fold-1 n=1 Tax=Dillenia turbinata TaxID=194707 RepID=A0AAN8V5R6_9MAGN